MKSVYHGILARLAAQEARLKRTRSVDRVLPGERRMRGDGSSEPRQGYLPFRFLRLGQPATATTARTRHCRHRHLKVPAIYLKSLFVVCFFCFNFYSLHSSHASINVCDAYFISAE